MSTETKGNDAVRVGHSPTPWRVQADPVVRSPRLGRMALVITPNGRTSIDVTGSGETYAQDVANAAYIVRAVNAHEALLSAAKDALRELGADRDFDLSLMGMRASSSPGIQQLAATIDRLNAAVTLATEGR